VRGGSQPSRRVGASNCRRDTPHTWRGWGPSSATEIGANATAEARPLGDHLFLGGGFGVVNLQIARVTSPESLYSTGPSVLGRIGYDFGMFLPYVALELEVQWQADGATPWGPTLQVGVKL
jgi:hypothetical protein